MRRLFRSFEKHRLRYLLISGQASVLYGAATFSEDIDIWIEPTRSNAARLVAALAALKARVFKLTPPLTVRNMLAGHGFHFVVPAMPLPIYLDVMGKPPRVGSFADAAAGAQVMPVEGVRIPVVAPRDLVQLKLTRRLSDYEVISNLTRGQVMLRQREGGAGRALLRRALRESFNAEDRIAWQRALGAPVSDVEACRRAIAREIANHQRRDVVYWKSRIAELRRHYRARTLLPVGALVAEVMGPVANTRRRPKRRPLRA